MPCLPKLQALIKKIPGYSMASSLLYAHKNSKNLFLRSAPPGHFYSPIPDLDFILKRRKHLFLEEKFSCPGIELNLQRQLELVRSLATYYDQIPFPETNEVGSRYYLKNPYFGHGSSIILYSLMRHFSPQTILEVGSGFSSAAMLDVNDKFFEGKIRFTFVEPYPERLVSLLTESDKTSHRICVDAAQDIPQNIYTQLNANDILFIDSSHVAKAGSDVVFLLTEILPLLSDGVIIHIHDIYWPFEYPEEWILSGRAWNEAYMIKAFLQFNTSFEILLFNSYLTQHHQDFMSQHMPLFIPDGGSSLWIRKIPK